MNRRGHTTLTLSLATLSVPPAIILGSHIPETIPLSAAFIGGVLFTIPVRVKVFGQVTAVYLNPDMDIRANQTYFAKMTGLAAYERFIRHRSGMYARHWRGVWKQPWKVFFFSHAPFFGTIPRWLLFPVLPLLLGCWMSGTWDFLNWPILGMILVGMSWSDLWHVISDRISSEVKGGLKEVGDKNTHQGRVGRDRWGTGDEGSTWRRTETRPLRPRGSLGQIQNEGTAWQSAKSNRSPR